MMKTILLIIILALCSANENDIDKYLTFKNLKIRHALTDIVIERGSLNSQNLQTFEDIDSIRSYISESYYVKVEKLFFGKSFFVFPEEKYGSSFTLNDVRFEVEFPNSTIIKVGDKLDKSILIYNHRFVEHNASMSSICFYYYFETNTGESIAMDHNLSIDFNPKTMIILRIVDYPVP